MRNLTFIHTYSLETPSGLITCLGGLGFTSVVSAVWPAANDGIFVPFNLEERMIITKLWTSNGATAAGNTDIGIYSERFTSIISKGATAQAGTSVTQEFDITDTELWPGTYYMAMSNSLGTSTFLRGTSGNLLYLAQAGLFKQASVGTLPATATPVRVTADYYPLFGLAGRTLVG